MTQQILTPEWVKHAIFYQIFPDRFKRSDVVSPPAGVRLKSWGSPPEEQGFQGGDLYGIVESLDYLRDLGITALYLNPIFSSAANHRYHTFDYYRVDPLLGGNEALRVLLDEAHERNMRVVLDGVFNHASRGFWPFHHILENGPDSPYIDWFTIHDWPLTAYPRNESENINYAAWWGLPALPKLNTKNPEVQKYILDVAVHWISFGIDGWRLDVPAEIDDDDFWRRFRTAVKEANPETYICGEIWEEAKRWLQGDQFDAVMNYTVSWAAMSFFGGGTLRSDYNREHLFLQARNAQETAEVIDRMYGWYDWEINLAQLNLLDSHDTARALWILGEDKSALKLCVLMQMTLPGAPCIYYGDEIGMSAGDDPACRAAFPWQNTEQWDTDLLYFYREACLLRHRFEVLRIGDFETVFAREMTWGFRRSLGQSCAYVVFNAGFSKSVVSLSVDGVKPKELEMVWPAQSLDFEINNPTQIELSMPPRTTAILIGQGG